jgi:hypothetical protein
MFITTFFPRWFRRRRLFDRCLVSRAAGAMRELCSELCSELCTSLRDSVISPELDRSTGLSGAPLENQSSRAARRRVDAPGPSWVNRFRKDLTSTPAMPESCGRCLEEGEEEEEEEEEEEAICGAGGFSRFVQN